MGKLKKLVDSIDEIIGIGAEHGWYDMQDRIREHKEVLAGVIYDAVEKKLKASDNTVDDYEALVGEDLYSLIQREIDIEWKVPYE